MERLAVFQIYDLTIHISLEGRVDAKRTPWQSCTQQMEGVPLSRAGKQGKTMAKDDKTLTTLTGQYCLVGNPCTTEPCLPGMASAILAGGVYYFLRAHDRWISENSGDWDDYRPRAHDRVTVIGYTQKRKDVFGNPFYAIDVVSLKPAE